MGLDIAEFFLAVEEEFGVNTFEQSMIEFDTLNDLVSYLEQATALAPHTLEETQHVFLREFTTVQSFFAKELDIPLSELTPEMPIAPLLEPLAFRRRFWKALQSKLRDEYCYNVPKLQGRTYQRVGGGVCVLLGFFCGLLVVIESGAVTPISAHGFIGVATGFFVGMFLYMLGTLVFSPWFSTIPESCRTLGGVVKYVVPLKPSLDPDGQPWNRETIEKAVLRAAAENTGMPLKKLSLASRFRDIF